MRSRLTCFVPHQRAVALFTCTQTNWAKLEPPTLEQQQQMIQVWNHPNKQVNFIKSSHHAVHLMTSRGRCSLRVCYIPSSHLHQWSCHSKPWSRQHHEAETQNKLHPEMHRTPWHHYSLWVWQLRKRDIQIVRETDTWFICADIKTEQILNQ